MLAAEVIGTGRTTGEVRPARCKIGWNCAAGAGQGSRDGDYPAMEATVAPCCLPVGLDFAGFWLFCRQQGEDGPSIWEMSAYERCRVY